MTQLPLTHANMISLLGIEELPLDQRKEIVETALELVEMRTMSKVLDAIGKDKANQFAEVMESKNDATVSDFLKENNIDILAIMEGEVEAVKRELLGIAQEI
tara:strand:- start:792 stop:1097 length:306 start_codon:yes stop_codon:yes gene_type:complete